MPATPLRLLACVLALLLGACTAAPLSRPAAGAVLQASGGVNRSEHRDKPYLILISFDGFHPAYLGRFDLPNFARALRRGVRAEAMMPVFPSLTFPNHYSLVTGLTAERHGLVGNTFYDPERKAVYTFRDRAAVSDGTWYRGEPIWVTAETQGMVSACYFWPGSEAPVKGVHPTVWHAYDASVPNETRVAAVLEWLRRPAERRPHVVTLYFSELDSTSHQHPLDAPAIAGAARSLDRALGALLDGLDALPIRDRVYLLLTSDHGMAETSRAQTVMLDSVVELSRVRVGFTGPIASLHVTDGTDPAAIRDHINGRLRNGRAYVRSEIPERYRYRDPRVGDIVILMNEGWTVAQMRPLTGLIRERWGLHGWDPALPSMQALFVLTGPGIPPNVRIPPVENIDVYPLMTELLGLRAAAGIDGRPGRIQSLIAGARVR